MKDIHKHNVAKAIYTFICTLKREMSLIWKPLLLGLLILIVFATIAEWSDFLFGRNYKFEICVIGVIVAFIPLINLYYKRLKIWVLKWKEPIDKDSI